METRDCGHSCIITAQTLAPDDVTRATWQWWYPKYFGFFFWKKVETHCPCLHTVLGLWSFWHMLNDTQPNPTTSNVKSQNHVCTTITEPSNSTYTRHVFTSYIKPQAMAQEHFVDYHTLTLGIKISIIGKTFLTLCSKNQPFPRRTNTSKNFPQMWHWLTINKKCILAGDKTNLLI